MKIVSTMVSNFALLIAVICFFTITSCKNNNQNGEEAIRQARKAIDAGWLSEDIDVILKHCSDNVIWLLKGVGKISGKEECRAFLQSTFEKIDIKEMKITDTEIIVSGDYGYEMNTSEAVTLPKGSNEENRFTLYSILIWHKETDGTWKEIRGTW